MSRCGCGSSGGCSCRLSPGPGINISGSGTPVDPFVITAEVTTFADSFQAQDTPTVSLDLVGSGTSLDPFILRADTAITMEQLANWDDASGPATGDVAYFNGVSWEAAPMATVSSGAVNASGGITGDGTVVAPLRVAVSTTSTTSTSGTAIYLDSAGQLRAVPGATDWSAITSIPTSFPSAWATLTGKPASYPDSARIGGHAVFVQTGSPTGANVDDLWVKKP